MEPPTFVETLKPIHAIEGDQVIFTCIVSGKPAPTLTWFLNDIDISNSDDFVIDYDVNTGKCECIIVETFPEDAGMYKCIATNCIGEATSAAELVVSKQTEGKRPAEVEEARPVAEEIVPEMSAKKQPPPFIEKQPSPEEIYPEITKSEEVTLKEEGRAVPPAQEQQIEPVQAVHPPSEQDLDTDAMTVRVVTRSPPKEQSKIAKTERVDFGPASTGIPTMVFVRKDFETITKEEEDHVEPTQFTQPIRPQVVEEGGTAVFMAVLTGTDPEITWYKDHVVLEQGKDPRITMVYNSDEHTSLLTIENARPDDFGNYTCEALNMAGRAKCTANLVVVRKYPTK